MAMLTSSTTQYPFSGTTLNTVSLPPILMKSTIFISNAKSNLLPNNILYQIIIILVFIMFCFVSCCVIYQYRASRQRKHEILELTMKIDQLLHVRHKSVPSNATAATATTTTTPKSTFSSTPKSNVQRPPNWPISPPAIPQLPPMIFASHHVSETYEYDTNPVSGLHTNVKMNPLKRKSSHSMSCSAPSDSTDDIPLPALTPTDVEDEKCAKIIPLMRTARDSILVNVPEDDVVDTFDENESWVATKNDGEPTIISDYPWNDEGNEMEDDVLYDNNLIDENLSRTTGETKMCDNKKQRCVV